MSLQPKLKTYRRAPLCMGLCCALAIDGAILQPVLAAEVQNCGDGVAGSLRDVIMSAAPGEIVDLSQLPMKCGMTDSVITLTDGEIVVMQDGLSLAGPSVGSVTIRPAPNTQSRIFNQGSGLFFINDLILEGGSMQGSAQQPDADGGCIRAAGTVFLTRTSIRNCTASGTHAQGGAVYAMGGLVLDHSVISGSKALGSVLGRGGGAAVFGGTWLLYSTVSGNSTSHFGGGLYSRPQTAGAWAEIYNSTIEGNSAANCGGASLYNMAGSMIVNSTVSGNAATHDGGLCTMSANVANSTIAFNTGASASGGLNVFLGSLELQSTILAQNSGDPGMRDLFLSPNASITGSDNLVNSASGNIPVGVIEFTTDPKLGPLQHNGGRTLTHALLPGSPAIGAGNNGLNESTDQRGRGYPRMTGPATDIGAFQFDSIFYDDFDG